MMNKYFGGVIPTYNGVVTPLDTELEATGIFNIFISF